MTDRIFQGDQARSGGSPTYDIPPKTTSSTTPSSPSEGEEEAVDNFMQALSDIETLQGEMSTAQGDIVWASGQLESIDTDVSDLESTVALNTTHRTSDGADHAYIDQDITNGSSPTFDGANITGVDADNVDIADSGALITATDVEGALAENRALIDSNTTHASSNGTDHTYIDQDVTTSASPTFAGGNFSGGDVSGINALQANTLFTYGVQMFGGEEDIQIVDNSAVSYVWFKNTHRVGIGTDTPSNELSVVGSVDISQDLTVTGDLTVNGTTTQDLVNLKPGSAPASGVQGDVYYDSSANKLKVCVSSGTPGTWETITSA